MQSYSGHGIDCSSDLVICIYYAALLVLRTKVGYPCSGCKHTSYGSHENQKRSLRSLLKVGLDGGTQQNKDAGVTRGPD